MKHYLKLFLSILLFFIINPIAVYAQEKTLKVGVALGEPFAAMHNNKFEGIAVDLWKLIAEEDKLQYEFISEGEHIDEAINKLATGQIDILIGPIIPTYERTKLVDFMQPYYIAQIGLVVPKQKIKFFNVMHSIFNTTISSMLLIVLFFFLFYLHIFWYFEIRPKQTTKHKYKEGISEAFWLHTLDIDLANIPSHIRTRQIRFIWLIFLTLFFSTITASITSALTIALSNHYVSYTNLSDFSDKNIAAVVATAPYDLAKTMDFKIVETNNREEAIQLVLDGKADAFVDYYPIATYYLSQHQLNDKLTMANVILQRNTFAFALPINSPYRHQFDLILRSHQEYGLAKTVCEKYFNQNQAALINCEI